MRKRKASPSPGHQTGMAVADILGMAAFNASRIPPCPECGAEPTTKVTKPLGGDFVVRVPCPHQIDALNKAEALARDLEEVGRFQTRNADLISTRPHEGVTLAKVDLARTPTAQEALGAADTFLRTWPERKAQGSVLGLVGDGGTGKSLVLSALAQSLERNGVTTLFLTAPALLERSRRLASPIADLTTGVGFLVLDDLGTEDMTSKAYEIFFQVLDARHAAGKPWAWSSNLGVRELYERWARQLEAPPTRWPKHEAALAARRLVSRLSERVSIQTLQGKDQRLANRQDWLKKEGPAQ